MEWLLEVASGSDYRTSPSFKYKVFRIDNEQVLGALELKPRAGLRYSYDEFADKEMKIRNEGSRVNGLQEQGIELALFDRKILSLAEHMQEYLKVAQHRSPLVIPPTVENPEDREDDWKSLADLMPDFL